MLSMLFYLFISTMMTGAFAQGGTTSTTSTTSTTPSVNDSQSKIFSSAYIQIGIVFTLVGLGIAVGANWNSIKLHMSNNNVHHADKELDCTFVSWDKFRVISEQQSLLNDERFNTIKDALSEVKSASASASASSIAAATAAAASAATAAAVVAARSRVRREDSISADVK